MENFVFIVDISSFDNENEKEIFENNDHTKDDFFRDIYENSFYDPEVIYSEFNTCIECPLFEKCMHGFMGSKCPRCELLP